MMSQPDGFGQPPQYGQPYQQNPYQQNPYQAQQQVPPQAPPQAPPMYSGYAAGGAQPAPNFPPQIPKMMTDPGIENPWYGISWGNAIKRYWKNYVNFRGRASRGEYWWMILFNAIANAVLSIFLVIGINWFVVANAFARFAECLATMPGYSYSYSYSYSSASLFSYSSCQVGAQNVLNGFGIFILVVIIVWWLANLIPGLTLVIRRLHDTNRPWPWIFIYLIPFGVGAIWFIVLMASKPYPYANRWNAQFRYQPHDQYYSQN
jgi:uncharacterized membrane protein YhaH (DUF805 family)